MFTFLILKTAYALTALPVMVADTPPALPIAVSQLASLKTMQDVIGVSVLETGARAPSNLVLPELLNRRQTLEYMRVHYPKSMLEVVTKTMPIAWVLVNTGGKVTAARLLTSS